jgi:hypothetical protein
MARFYDAADSAELARIEAVLKKGGVEYSLSGADDFINEILVAEEDLAYAERLLVQESVARREARVAHQ